MISYEPYVPGYDQISISSTLKVQERSGLATCGSYPVLSFLYPFTESTVSRKLAPTSFAILVCVYVVTFVDSCGADCDGERDYNDGRGDVIKIEDYT